MLRIHSFLMRIRIKKFWIQIRIRIQVMNKQKTNFQIIFLLYFVFLCLAWWNIQEMGKILIIFLFFQQLRFRFWEQKMLLAVFGWYFVHWIRSAYFCGSGYRKPKLIPILSTASKIFIVGPCICLSVYNKCKNGWTESE